MLPYTALFSVLVVLASHCQAASKDQWRSRNRFAPPTAGQKCNAGTYCGGTWNTIIDHLDYIQGLGFDSVYISSTGLGLDEPTPWGENYHGYWSVDPFVPNPHFGTSADLKALSAAVHNRGMLFMVDFVANHLGSSSDAISDSALAVKSGGQLLFKQEADFHPPCKIDYGSDDSVKKCWMAMNGVYLMDMKTEDARVADVLIAKFAEYIKEYDIDGARLDGAKHMGKEFLHNLCAGAGNLYCIAEVFSGSVSETAFYTESDGVDSTFGFSMMYAAVDVFTKGNRMSALSSKAKEAKNSYSDPTLISFILDNHDLPRFSSLTSDQSNIYNAMALEFLWGGIPAMYYGLEHGMTGLEDPDNREALWLHGGFQQDGESYKRIARLNAIRKQLGDLGGFHEVVGTEVAVSDSDIAFERNGGLLILTNRGAGQSGTFDVPKAGFPANAALVDLLSCSTAKAGSDGSLEVNFKNGLPFFYVTSDIASQTDICGGSAAPPSTSDNNSPVVAAEPKSTKVVNETSAFKPTATKSVKSDSETTTLSASPNSGADSGAGGKSSTTTRSAQTTGRGKGRGHRRPRTCDRTIPSENLA